LLLPVGLVVVTSNTVDYGPASCGGAGILVIATTTTGCLLAASHVLDRGDEAGQVGATVAEELLATVDSGSCVDEYLQDQLIIFMALAAGACACMS
jgi:RNA 3'-terminal phosphate cyclase